jgi:hypothetical protein
MALESRNVARHAARVVVPSRAEALAELALFEQDDQVDGEYAEREDDVPREVVRDEREAERAKGWAGSQNRKAGGNATTITSATQ